MLRPEKLIVKAFYDTYGWVRDGSGRYHDSVDFADRRPVLAWYERKTRERVRARLSPGGCLFLDAGCGAIPIDDDLDYSKGFERRVCVDISRAALKEARARLGDAGLYVQADLACLPFRDDVFASAVCAHALYHVPADEQEAAVRELHRTLAPAGTCVILYAAPRSPLSELAVRLASLVPSRLLRARERSAAGRVDREHAIAARRRPPLYFHAHEPAWFRRALPSDWDVDVRAWRATDYRFTRTIVGDGLFGRTLMRLVYAVEALLPRAALRLGGYPMIVIRKAPAGQNASVRNRMLP